MLYITHTTLHPYIIKIKLVHLIAFQQFIDVATFSSSTLSSSQHETENGGMARIEVVWQLNWTDFPAWFLKFCQRSTLFSWSTRTEQEQPASKQWTGSHQFLELQLGHMCRWYSPYQAPFNYGMSCCWDPLNLLLPWNSQGSKSIRGENVLCP